jgi:alpha/beta superfamily hydrolase
LLKPNFVCDGSFRSQQEALLEEPDDQAPRMAAVLCHPHPLYGGTRHNKVV